MVFLTRVSIGWSTGVQVGLELAALFPERVGKLVLVCGAHGQCFSSCFQPLFRVPVLPSLLHYALLIVDHQCPWLWSVLGQFASQYQNMIRVIFLKPFDFLRRADYEWFGLRYILDIFAHGELHTRNYICLIQQLDTHSCFHLLDTIATPTLILTGFLDVLTPSYHSFEMARRMPNAKLVVYNLGSHFILVEYPLDIAKQISTFLQSAKIQ